MAYTVELTEREREVLSGISDGMEQRELAPKLYMSLGTLKGHMQHIFQKLGATNSAHAVAMALRKGIIE